jgi:hypothetical protein
VCYSVSMKAEKVIERDLKTRLPGCYDRYPRVFIFPKKWEFEKCRKYCRDKNYNVYCFGETPSGRNKFTTTYSWRLNYMHMFGEYPME